MSITTWTTARKLGGMDWAPVTTSKHWLGASVLVQYTLAVLLQQTGLHDAVASTAPPSTHGGKMHGAGSAPTDRRTGQREEQSQTSQKSDENQIKTKQNAPKLSTDQIQSNKNSS